MTARIPPHKAYRRLAKKSFALMLLSVWASAAAIRFLPGWCFWPVIISGGFFACLHAVVGFGAVGRWMEQQ